MYWQFYYSSVYQYIEMYVLERAQKQGDGVFEAQCAARIQERLMMDHALSVMD